MRRTHGNTYLLDDLDRRLLEILHSDPRTSNRSMAHTIGITDETVAARLRRMLESGAMAMTAVIDWRAAGYQAHGVARACFERGVLVNEAVKPLFDVDEVFAVSETTGVADAVIHMLARDLAGLHELVTKHLRTLEGVAELTVDVVSDVVKQSIGISTLPIQPWKSASLPDPLIPLDELDHSILEVLATDAHESNRELSRRLGVSDGTVRARLSRMESAGLLRIVAMVDPVTTGEVGAVGLVFFSMDGPADDLIDALSDDASVPSISRCVGDYDLMAIIDAANSDELHARVSRQLRQMPGVRKITIADVVDVLLHRAHLGRLL